MTDSANGSIWLILHRDFEHFFCALLTSLLFFWHHPYIWRDDTVLYYGGPLSCILGCNSEYCAQPHP